MYSLGYEGTADIHIYLQTTKVFQSTSLTEGLLRSPNGCTSHDTPYFNKLTKTDILDNMSPQIDINYIMLSVVTSD